MRNFTEKLNELINKYELSHLKDKILSVSEESILLTLGDKEDYSKIGNSRCAGYPNLPENIIWPIITEPNEYEKKLLGLRKLFALQINLEELPDIGKLPNEGMLYFFIGCNDISYEGEGDSEVIFYPQKLNKVQNLVDKIDATYCLYKDPEDKFHLNNGYKLEFEKILTIPGPYSSLTKGLQLKESESIKYDDLYSEYCDFIYSFEYEKIGNFSSKMFGNIYYGWHDIKDMNSQNNRVNNNPKDWEVLLSLS